MLRDYQQRAIGELYDWFGNNPAGNPCVVLPTGAGKSHIVAALCKDAVSNWPDTRILMLTHVKELIEQNAAKMREHWPNAPMGIYSASIGKRQLGEPITLSLIHI
jgi:DNA repair protein RadD